MMAPLLPPRGISGSVQAIPAPWLKLLLGGGLLGALLLAALGALSLVALSALSLAAAPAGAVESASPPGGAGAGKLPVDIQADNAIEWHQDQKAYVARGHASAVRGTSTIYADVLTAYYRDSKEKGPDIFRIAAEGNVHIVSPAQELFGEHGIYDVDRQIGLLTGQGLRLQTKSEVVTARDSLEYYDLTKLAVARGDAVAVRNQDRLRADILIAHFAESPAKTTPPATAKPGKTAGTDKAASDKTNKDGKDGKDWAGSHLDRLDGVGGVVITTPQDVALCDRVLYSFATEIAVLKDNVRITRGKDQINGDAAEMNMKTHVNRVLGSGRRVEGLLIPKAEPAKKSDRDKVHH